MVLLKTRRRLAAVTNPDHDRRRFVGNLILHHLGKSDPVRSSRPDEYKLGNATMAKQEPKIFHPSEIPAVDRGAGVKTIPLLTKKTGATSFINGLTIFPANGSVPLHKHNCDESVLVLEGFAIAEIAGAEHQVAQGDVTFIPEGVHHRFRNMSQTEEMRILWTYASIDADRTIIATGETHRIDDEHSAAAD